MPKDITFTNIFGFDLFPPQPAVKEVPDWYKNTSEYIGDNGKKVDKDNVAPVTIKKCIPIFDSITAGYIIYTQVDVQVSQQDGLPYYNWASQNAISFHPIEQAKLYPTKNQKNSAFAKWNNPYAISTPSGYSVLFTQPLHRESPFTILSGIVDTDMYKAPVNFPFTLNDVGWEGMIPAGTPMAQIIPIKRDSWKHTIGSKKEFDEQNIVLGKLKNLYFNSYKKQFWNKKEYR